jgi:hypothetical protein
MGSPVGVKWFVKIGHLVDDFTWIYLSHTPKTSGDRPVDTAAGYPWPLQKNSVGIMTFQAYLDAVKEKTGKTPEQLMLEATQLGVYRADMKAAALYALGRGHAMSVWAVWKAKGWVQAPK